MDKVANVLGSIVTVALVAVIVSNRAGTAGVIRALGGAFANAVGAATRPVR